MPVQISPRFYSLRRGRGGDGSDVEGSRRHFAMVDWLFTITRKVAAEDIDTWCAVARGMTRDGGSAALFGGVHGDAAGKS